MVVDIPTVPKENQVGWLINLERCVGCRACEGACKNENKVAVGVRWRRVVTRQKGEYPSPVKYYVTSACHHCAQPACIKSCPVDAITKRAKDGIVLIDQEKCIGCRRCIWACPYGAPQYNPETNKVEKCTYCVHRIDKGLKPACALTCMGLALDNRALADIDKTHATASQEITGFNPTFTEPSTRFIKAKKM
ncbi:MAG: 4Fe-4S dicluster domain-containing protein [Thaumarchaeota archaeon]|nr:4Fe-4S dicluster domain-containing protein [Nitrososphaerota archaeon]